MIRLPICLSLVALVACGGKSAETASEPTDPHTSETEETEETEDTEEADSLAIIGAWADDWGGAHDISASAWASTDSSFAITWFDNDLGALVAQNDAGNAWNPGMWSRFEWAWIDGDLRYCQVAYDAASEADAMAAGPADPASPSSGCNGFSWTRLRPPLSITGGWDDNWGGGHSVDPFVWWSGDASYAISQSDDAASWLVAQNGSDNAWNPDLWSRFDWAWQADGSVAFCQTAYAAASEDEALATPAADPSNVASGCGGFSWSFLRPTLPIGGAWVDSWGGSHDIDAFVWTSGSSWFDITAWDADAGWVVAQNAESNEWNPGMWSRFDWAWDSEGALWYCQTAYAAASEADALATPAADATDPSTGGCGAFSWTGLEPAP